MGLWHTCMYRTHILNSTVEGVLRLYGGSFGLSKVKAGQGNTIKVTPSTNKIGLSVDIDTGGGCTRVRLGFNSRVRTRVLC